MAQRDWVKSLLVRLTSLPGCTSAPSLVPQIDMNPLIAQPASRRLTQGSGG
jgi:hypothetical protein